MTAGISCAAKYLSTFSRPQSLSRQLLDRQIEASLPWISFLSWTMHLGRNGPRGSSTWWQTPSISRKTTVSMDIPPLGQLTAPRGAMPRSALAIGTGGGGSAADSACK